MARPEENKAAVPTVAPRNDLRTEPVFVKATIADQAGARPGYRRQWFAKDDPRHPGHFQKYLDTRLVGDESIGYAKLEGGWNVVNVADAKPGRPRDDQGKPVETALTHGDLICLEISEADYQVYQAYDRLRDLERQKHLRQGDSEKAYADNGGVATYRARTGVSPGSHRDLLNQPLEG